MKYSSIIVQLPRLLNGQDAEDYCSCRSMLQELCEKWGLRPIDKKHRMTTYDRHDIDAAIERKKEKELKD